MHVFSILTLSLSPSPPPLPLFRSFSLSPSSLSLSARRWKAKLKARTTTLHERTICTINKENNDRNLRFQVAICFGLIIFTGIRKVCPFPPFPTLIAACQPPVKSAIQAGRLYQMTSYVGRYNLVPRAFLRRGEDGREKTLASADHVTNLNITIPTNLW